jgi:RNA polymerase sigma-70 factor (ECF subfamily)
VTVYNSRFKLAADVVKIQASVLLRRAVRKKDKEALGRLHTIYYPQLKRYIASRVGSVEDAEDLAQSVFFELCKGNAVHKDCGNAEAYLFGIAKNLINLYYRSKSRQVKTIPLCSVGEFAGGGAVRPSQKAAKQVSLEQCKKLIEDARALLPPKARQAVELKFIEGYSVKEASQMVGCSVWTFYKRLDKAARVLEGLSKTSH